MTDKTEDRGDDILDPAAEEAAKQAAEAKAAEEAAAAKKAEDDGVDEEEGQETDEERAEREAAEAKAAEEADKKKRNRIPLSRHEEVLRAAREKAEKREAALIDQIRQLQAGRTDVQQRNVLKEMADRVEELQDKYEELILDGKRDEARAVRKEISAAQDQVAEFRAATVSAASRASALETLKFEAALAKAESDYPQINPDHPDLFDEDLTTEVADLTDTFVKSKRMSRHEAFGKAVKYVLGPPKGKDAADTAAKDASELARKRAEEARKKAAEAAGKQPQDGTKAGKDNDKGGSDKGEIDVMRMSQDKFAKMDEETKARLRGDSL